VPPPSAARDVRSGFGRTPAPDDRTPEDRATSDDEQLEDLLGEARRTAGSASVEDLEGDDVDPDELIDDFANPPLDDDPIRAPDLEAERAAEERASRTNGER
jgi:hypothetical protein